MRRPFFNFSLPSSAEMVVTLGSTGGDNSPHPANEKVEWSQRDHDHNPAHFDGGPTLPRGMRDIRDLAMITDAILRRGYSEARSQKFLGGNLLRVFRQITEKSSI